MLLHKVTYEVLHTAGDKITLETRFAGSNKDAGIIRKEARQTFGFVPHSIETIRVDIPINKTGLIEVLNHCVTDSEMVDDEKYPI
jgi:hypothetical protein